MKGAMASGGRRVTIGRACPRCDMCSRPVRVGGVGVDGVLCSGSLADALPFVGLERGSEFLSALTEYRQGLNREMGDYGRLRFDPFEGEETRGLEEVSQTLKGCSYVSGGGVSDQLKEVARDGGCLFCSLT